MVSGDSQQKRTAMISGRVILLESSEATFDLDQFMQDDDVRLLGVDADGTGIAADEFRDVRVDIGRDVDLNVVSVIQRAIEETGPARPGSSDGALNSTRVAE